jgi:Ser-tRNA(Ala) deacylase AlaX
MSQTLPLFHEEPYLKQLECRVDLFERDDAGLPFALLSQTVFYPQGGGQLGDRGLLSVLIAGEGKALRTLEIVSTKKRDDQIRHYLNVDDEAFMQLQERVIGQQATATLGWSLRYHQMRLHSAMHLMHCMLEQTLGRSIPHPVRSPLSDDVGENQYEFVAEFNEDNLKQATDALNEFCSAGHEIRTQADISKGQGFRWWQCEHWTIPCGGVHVRNTREVGVVTSSMKIKKNTTRVVVTLSTEAEELG